MLTMALGHYSNNSMTSVYTTQRQATQSLYHSVSVNLFASRGKLNQLLPYESVVMQRKEV